MLSTCSVISLIKCASQSQNLQPMPIINVNGCVEYSGRKWRLRTENEKLNDTFFFLFFMNRKENICLCAGEKSQKKQVSDLLLFQWAFCDEIIFRSVKNAIDVCLVWKKKFNLAWSALGNVRCETSVLLELFLSVELNETLLMIKINKMHFFNSLEGFLTNLLFGVQKVIYTLSQIFLQPLIISSLINQFNPMAQRKRDLSAR